MVVFWFRRDLRLDDNVGLYKALESGEKVLPIFIFDKEILQHLPSFDRRVDFIHQQIEKLHQQLVEMGSALLVFYGNVAEIWQQLCETYPIHAVYANHDYEPYAISRDNKIKDFLATKNIDFQSYKDQVIFEKTEILSGSGTPYTVFTPYSKKWKATLTPQHYQFLSTETHFHQFWKCDAPIIIPRLQSMGFEPTNTVFPNATLNLETLQSYHLTRDFPANTRGTTHLGIHLRFGTISIRKLVAQAIAKNETYLNELIWREFYMQILWNFPHVVSNSFRPEYDAIPWRNDEKEFEKWCQGKTGYALVDAGMRQLNETGMMHNRVRMVVASFLTKHLLIDWRWGEAYFAQKLLDFELSSNNGGWQWAAGSGCDAAPYFRVFNPDAQLDKFDKQGQYIRKWVKEFGTPLYPKPMVEHKFARERAIETYKDTLKKQ